MDFSSLSAIQISQLVSQKKVSATEVTQHFLRRMNEGDKNLGAFLRIDTEGALAQAARLDSQLSREGGQHFRLCGVPIAIKDMIITKDLETTAGSKILQGFVPPYESTVVARLREAGAIIVGKTNMDEFAMGSSNENSAYKPCKNPWDVTRVPGGSSGGSAAAVAADFCPISLGTDTGGSIRQPAALCGVTGIKPTYGRVSRYGVLAFASSLDQVGPFARYVEDAALSLEVIGGYDAQDSTSIMETMPNLVKACQGSVKGLRIGVPAEYFGKGLDPAIETLVKDAIQLLVSEGATVVPISLPLTKYAVAVYYMIATAEASSNLARYDGVRYGHRSSPSSKEQEQSLLSMYEMSRGEGFGAEVKRRILLGTYVLRSGHYDAYYKRASQVRTLIRQDFLRAFQTCDVIATPTSPIPAFRAGERVTDPLAMYLADIYTISCNLAGLPGISIPCGFMQSDTNTKLPVGIQFLAAPLEEESLFRVAGNYQKMTDFHTQRPSFEKSTEVVI